MPIYRKDKISLVSLFAIIFASQNAYAETNSVEEIKEKETIVITAKRKTENIQDSALSVSSITGKQIEQAAIFSTNRVQQLQPAVQFYSQNARNTTLNIRGLGAPFGLTNDGIEQGVGFYIDDVYYARAASATLDFVDVSQIEILRGPQGTLYGKNTTAGALNITTRAPSFEAEGRGSVTFGNYGFLQVKGSASAPLSENIAARLSTSYTKRDGFAYNVARGEHINELDNFAIRGQLLWNANDKLSFNLYGDYAEQKPNGAGQVYVKTAPTLRSTARQYAALAAFFNYQVPSTNPFDRLVDHNSPTKGLQHNSGIALKANWEVGNGKLTSISSWRTWSWRPSNDRDWIGLSINTISANPSDQEQWQQEFRYNGKINDKIDYVAGLFYFKQEMVSSGNSALGEHASYWLNGPTTGTGASAVNARTGLDAHFGVGNWGYAEYSSVLNGRKQTNDIKFNSESAALFGRATIKLTEKFTLEPGLRFNYDKKHADYNAVASGGLSTTNALLRAIQNGQLASSSYIADFKDNNISGDLTASYHISPDVLAYGYFAKAFKSGGINLNGIPNGNNGLPALEFATIKPESTNHYEIGLKSELFDKKAIINLAAFQTDIKDYQSIVQLAAQGSSTLRGVLASVPKVQVKGFEIESTYKPNSNLKFFANLAYSDGKYVDFKNAPLALENSGSSSATAAVVEDISGQDLPGISKWNATYGVEISKPAKILSANDNIYFAIDGFTRTKFSSSPTPSKYMWINGYSLVNLRAGIRTEDNFEIQAWVKNAGDTEYFNQLTAQGGSTGLIVGETGEPRTYGLTLSSRF